MFRNSVLKIRDFRNLWLAQATSQFGDAFYIWIFIYMVDQITKNPVTVGYMGVLEGIPFLLFSPLAGVAADRIDRKKIMRWADLASFAWLMILAATVFLLKTPPIWLLFLSGFSLSTINTFFMPAKGALIPQLVPKEKLMEANGLSAATQNMMPLIGMGLSGGGLVIVQKLYPDLFFPIAIFLNALTFLGSAYFVSKLPTLRIPRTEEESHDHIGAIIKDAKDGLKYVCSKKVLKVAFGMQTALFLLTSLYMTTYITINRVRFGGGFNTLALMEVMQGAAVVIASLIVAKIAFKKVSKPYIWGLIFSGGNIVGMALSQNFWYFLSFNAIAGFAFPFCEVPLSTYIQMAVPNEVLGRVNSLLTMITMGITPIGAFFAGHIIKTIGPGNVFAFMGVGLIITALVGLSIREFREELMPTEQADQKEETSELQLATQ